LSGVELVNRVIVQDGVSEYRLLSGLD